MSNVKKLKANFVKARALVAVALGLLAVFVRQALVRDPLFNRRAADAPLPFALASVATVPARDLPADFGPLPFKPRPDLPAVDLTFPIDWDQDPYVDRNWVAQLAMLRFPDSHIVQFEKTGDPRWLHWLVALLCDWSNHHVIRRRKSRYGWGDMMTGQRAARLAYLIGADFARPGVFTRWQRALLLFSAREHIHRMIDVTQVRMSNHTVDDLIGLRALQQVVPDPRDRQRIDAFVADVLPRLLQFQFTPSGVHRENSPAYHFHILGRLRFLRKSGWFEGFGLDELIDRVEQLGHWYRQPDGMIVPVGDSNGHPLGPLSRRWAVETGLRRADGYLIRRDCTAPGQVPPESYFFFMACAHSGFHKQSDCLSYHWFDRSPLATDTGKYAYKSDAKRMYAISARAHNSIEIGETNAIPNTLAELAAYPWAGDLLRTVAELPEGTLASGRVEHPRLHAAHTRTLLFRPGRFLLVADLVEDLPEPWPQWTADGSSNRADCTRPVTQWTHFASSITMQQAAPFLYTGQMPDGRALELRLAVAGQAAQTSRTEIIRGRMKPRMQGWTSEGYAEMTPRDAIGLTSDHKGRTWLASLLSLGQPAQDLHWDEAGNLMAVFTDETIALTPDNGLSDPQVHGGR